ncbi:hypothetical protein B0T16DRAFT_420025 [Cercophora newfieldiana]|uniref:Transglutaminase-like domain-containing protein n=1 Tax=Cercophora newfieldiana TaxID=92897 RepID=A0AA40CKA5_9PEZI|nr:hypothetical protein B0T16DRAFT_420025 [Cercophora newfieldiana]
MAEVEEPQFSTLAERIAALNRQKNFQAPPSGAAGKRAPPPPPPVRTATESVVSTTSAPKIPAVPPRPTRAATDDAASVTTPPLPRRKTEDVNANLSNGNGNGKRGMAPPPPPTPSRSAAPPLPSRNSQKQMAPPPELPSRRPSGQTVPVRRGSNSSDASHISAISSLSLNGTSDGQGGGRRLPPTLDQAKLPPLPPSRRDAEAAAKKAAEEEAAARSPSLPPRPGRSLAVAQPDERSLALPTRRLPPGPSSFRPNSNGNGFGFGSGRGAAPPPVPLSSRPTFEQIDAVASQGGAATHPAPAPVAPSKEPCLICRDFSGPDNLAAVFPLARLPRQDVVGYLAKMLCDPFPSHTDKARAIFTWCHHNIRYDVESFFGGCVRHITAEEGIFEGKAVCGGYATIYEAIATRAGLECIMVTGHGKGYGYHALKPGERPPPPDPTGHAWNALRIDGGKWKLIDACWGAGHLDPPQGYKQSFAPNEFVVTNIDFGRKHFPADRAHFFREDGRIPSWEEYLVGDTDGEPAKTYGAAAREGLNENNFIPREKHISVYSRKVVQFRFSKMCEHWTPEKNGQGKQMLFLLKIHGVGGRREDLVPLDYDGAWFSVDVGARDLGCPGQKISLYGLDTIDGRDGRGVTKEEWLRKKGKVGSSFIGIYEWELVQ